MRQESLILCKTIRMPNGRESDASGFSARRARTQQAFTYRSKYSISDSEGLGRASLSWRWNHALGRKAAFGFTTTMRRWGFLEDDLARGGLEIRIRDS